MDLAPWDIDGLLANRFGAGAKGALTGDPAARRKTP